MSTSMHALAVCRSVLAGHRQGPPTPPYGHRRQSTTVDFMPSPCGAVHRAESARRFRTDASKAPVGSIAAIGR